jgi:hypothetical protein
LSVSVIVGAAVLLTGAIVRDTIPKSHPDGEVSGNRWVCLQVRASVAVGIGECFLADD